MTREAVSPLSWRLTRYFGCGRRTWILAHPERRRPRPQHDLPRVRDPSAYLLVVPIRHFRARPRVPWWRAASCGILRPNRRSRVFLPDPSVASRSRSHLFGCPFLLCVLVLAWPQQCAANAVHL